jgi:hypothetical protein
MMKRYTTKRRENEEPICCNELMQPVYRFREEGIIKIEYVCNHCGRKEIKEKK